MLGSLPKSAESSKREAPSEIEALRAEVKRLKAGQQAAGGGKSKGKGKKGKDNKKGKKGKSTSKLPLPKELVNITYPL
eukprot:4345650-Karenia_brevis.AAC.1